LALYEKRQERKIGILRMVKIITDLNLKAWVTAFIPLDFCIFLDEFG